MRRRVYNLESEHKKMLEKFKSQIENKTKLNNEKIRLIIQLQSENNPNTKQQMEKRLEIINIEIKNIDVDNDKKEYFLNTSKMLYDYYKKDDNKILIEEETEKIQPSGTIHDLLHIVKTSNKSSILDKYMYTLNPDYQTNILEIENENICECGAELTLKRSVGEQVCMACGNSNDYVIDSEKKSYKNVPPDITYFAYKRMNHFNELIAQFQAKETTNIPADVYIKIKKELKKKRFYDLDKLNLDIMREILKKLKLTQFYDHIPHIIHKLNGKPILTLTREQEQKLRGMFKEIQEPFLRCSPDNRRNFLNYHYTFYKLFELLELDDFLPSIPLLKSKEKLFEHDQTWKCICEELNWCFYKT